MHDKTMHMGHKEAKEKEDNSGAPALQPEVNFLLVPDPMANNACLEFRSFSEFISLNTTVVTQCLLPILVGALLVVILVFIQVDYHQGFCVVEQLIPFCSSADASSSEFLADCFLRALWRVRADVTRIRTFDVFLKRPV